jgi:cell division inhibitor SulA
MRSAALALPAADAPPLAIGGVWRADRLGPSGGEGDTPARPTGFATLDAELPGGGWPAAGLTELLLAAPGCGELRLLAPTLAAVAMLWVAPPLLPYAPALAALGVALDRLTIATPARAADAAWAAEQALRSGALGAVLWWQGAEPVAPATLRRLHLAAQEGRTPLFALRPAAVRAQSSPAPLRLALATAAAAGVLALDVFKRRGPPMAAPLRLTLAGPAPRRARRAPVLSPPPLPSLPREPHDAVVRPAPAGLAA